MAVAKSAPKRMDQSRGPLRGPTVNASDADNAFCGQAPLPDLRTTEWSATLAPLSLTSFGSAREPQDRDRRQPPFAAIIRLAAIAAGSADLGAIPAVACGSAVTDLAVNGRNRC
jgi:hypothetical protein